MACAVARAGPATVLHTLPRLPTRRWLTVGTRCLIFPVQIQTRPGSKAVDDSEYTPQRALHQAIDDLQTELTTLRRNFDAEVARMEAQRIH